MGKEIKVGLSVLGVLATVFGVVLFKKLSPPSPAAVTTPSVANESSTLFPQSHETAKPSLNAEAPSTASRTLLKAADDDRYADTPAAETSPEPRQSFMPASERGVDPNDRYGTSARRTRFAVPESNDAGPTGADNPFRRGDAEAALAPPPADVPAEPATEPAVADDPAIPASEPASPAPLQPENARPIEPNPLRSGADVNEPMRSVVQSRSVRGEQYAAINDPQVIPAADERPVATDAAPAQQNFVPAAPPQQYYQAQPGQENQAVASPPQDYRTAVPPQNYQQSVVAEQPPVDDIPLGQSRSVLTNRSEPAEAAQVAYTQPIGPASYSAQDGRYAVQPNDSYWTISQKVYGKGGYFKAIYEHNKTKFPQADKLQVGDVLAVPPPAVLEQTYPDLCPKVRSKVAGVGGGAMIQTSAQRAPAGSRVYVVEEGDTLFDIARYELGKASRWGEIYDLNRETLGEDFDYLQPGTQLVLPGGGPVSNDSPDAMTRNPAAPYRR